MQATNASNQIMWKQFFRDAVLELNPGIFEHKLDAAHKAIQDRMLELRSSGSAERRPPVGPRSRRSALERLRHA